MKFGMNLLLWSGELNDGLMPVLESLKSMGYDGVELPIFNTDLDYAAWGKRLDDLGLELPTDEALDGVDGVARIDDGLALGGIAEERGWSVVRCKCCAWNCRSAC